METQKAPNSKNSLYKEEENWKNRKLNLEEKRKLPEEIRSGHCKTADSMLSS